MIVKHANPCGAAVADDLATAYSRAFDCDPRSAFGGVVAVSTVIDEATAEAMVAAAQADVVIAPGFAEGVVERLAARRANTRLLEAPEGRIDEPPWEVRTLGGLGRRVPGADIPPAGSRPRRLAGGHGPETHRRRDGRRRVRLAGVHPHQLQRDSAGPRWKPPGESAPASRTGCDAGQLAATKAAGRAAGGACASDGFYPFADGIHAAADAGAAVVVQPGGSVNDEAVIAAADERNLAMLFTRERQFRH